MDYSVSHFNKLTEKNKSSDAGVSELLTPLQRIVLKTSTMIGQLQEKSIAGERADGQELLGTTWVANFFLPGAHTTVLSLMAPLPFSLNRISFTIPTRSAFQLP